MSANLKYELFEQELLNPLHGHDLSTDERFVAEVLLDATSARPMGIKRIRRLSKELRSVQLSDRVVKAIIRRLKKDHEFPIFSRRKRPAGFWWGTSEEEALEYFRHAQRQPLDELHTLHRMMKVNFPRLAGQLTIADAMTQKSEPPA